MLILFFERSESDGDYDEALILVVIVLMAAGYLFLLAILS
jgi:hypothetical protein